MGRGAHPRKAVGVGAALWGLCGGWTEWATEEDGRPSGACGAGVSSSGQCRAGRGVERKADLGQLLGAGLVDLSTY